MFIGNNTFGQGNTCIAPIMIASLPYSDTGNTASYGDDYSTIDRPPIASGAIGTGGGEGYYLNGDDVVYSYTPIVNEIITISETHTSTYVGLFAFSGCPFAFTVGYHTATGGTARSIQNLPVTAGTTYYFVISTWASPQSTDYTINITQLPACTGTPNAGIVPSSLGICAGHSFNLVASGADTAQSGLSGQWQYRNPAGTGIWQDLAGATSASYTVTNAPNTAIDYRFTLTCGTSIGYSNELAVSVNNINQCYCVPSATNSVKYINDFSTTFGTQNISNLSTGFSIGGYGDFTAMEVSREIGFDINFSLKISGVSAGIRIWVDWNQDGVFDVVNEKVYNSSSYSVNHNGSFSVPLNALPGTTRMRIVSNTSSTTGYVSPCSTAFTNGEFEDYSFTVIAPSCFPVGVSPTISNLAASSADLSWNATTPAPGNGYDYYWNTTGVAPVLGTMPTGSTIAGVSSVSLTSLSPSTTYYFWVRGNCGPGNTSLWSQVTIFKTSQNPETLPYVEDFSSSSEWDLVNGAQVNQWNIGSATGNTGNGLYISNDGGITNAYSISPTASTSIVHAYRDILFTAGSNDFAIEFDWKSIGEIGFDYLRVWLVPITYVPVAGTQTTAATDRFQIGSDFNSNGLLWNSEHFILPNSISGQTVRLVFEWKNDGSVGDQPPAAIDNIKISEIYPCAIMPNAGTVPANVQGCSGQALTISSTGYTLNFSGITYQWQSSVSGANSWADIPGATSGTLATTAPALATDYRFKVTCSNSGLMAFSGIIMYAPNPPNFCHCLPLYEFGCSNGSTIDGVYTYNGTTNFSNLGTGCSASAYTNYSGIFSVSAVQTSYVDVIVDISDYDGYVTIWVDWNQDGIFANNEIGVQSNSITVAGTSFYGTFSVPSTALAGTTRMRVRVVENSSIFDACDIEDYGEAEDYDFIVIQAISCSGTPTAGIINGLNTVCANYGFFLQTTSIPESNISYQWQSKDSGQGNWVNVSGLNSYYVFVNGGISSATDYRLIITCLTGPYSDTTPVHTMSIKPVNQCPCVPEFSDGCYDGDEISDFSIFGENGTSIIDLNTICEPWSYDERTYIPAVDLKPGESYTALISSNYDSKNYAVIWIDFNNDGVFNEFISSSQPLPISERVAVHTSELDLYPGSAVAMQIPIEAPFNLVRMRVMVGFDMNGNPGSFLPCNDGANPLSFGEVHDYMVNITGSPLVISLGTLTAENQGKVNVLDWNTLKEADGDRFEIERSIDGRNFEVIAHLDGKGEPSTYRFIDEKPYSGVNYYRLGFLNIDAAKGYSKIVQATVKGGAFAIKAYPNPTSDLVKIHVLGTIIGKAIITISDVTGKVVKTIDMTQSEIDLSMSDLASGLYIIKYQDDVQNAVLKVTKN